MIDEGSQRERELALDAKTEPRNFSPALLGRQERGSRERKCRERNQHPTGTLGYHLPLDDHPIVSYLV